MNSALEKRLFEMKLASRGLRSLESFRKDDFLHRLAQNLEAARDQILEANAKDLAAQAPGTSLAFVDRLTLNPKRIALMAESLREVSRLRDPIGEVVEEKVLANGLRASRVRAPLGCLLMIFEARPNVITEAFSLAFKSGNVIALRGGSESKNSAAQIYALIETTLGECGLSKSYMVGLQDYDRALVTELLGRKDIFDIVVPRGGDKLIEMVTQTAAMPVIKNDRGLCHAFVDKDADLEMALEIIVNGKVQRPGVCNSLETTLVHRDIAQAFIPQLVRTMSEQGVELRMDEESLHLVAVQGSSIKRAQEKDWDTEYLDLILNVKVVQDLASALAHIEKHGSKHSEVIITKDEKTAEKFIDAVDAAAVYWNASSRFTDGFELGLGGELGISTQKLHVRGPVGLRELTNPRWILRGTGQIRS